MEREFTIGKNGYGDPRLEVTVDEKGRVTLTERDPHNGMRGNSIMIMPDELTELFEQWGITNRLSS